MGGHSTRARIQVAGELDLDTAPQLQLAVEQVSEAGYRHITVELSGLEFLSAAGLEVLCAADRACCARSGWLVLAHPPAQVRRLLQITGLDTVLTVHPTRAAGTAIGAPALDPVTVADSATVRNRLSPRRSGGSDGHARLA